MKTCLRVLIVVQIIAVALVGAALRADSFLPPPPGWSEDAGMVGFFAVLALSPIIVFISGRSGLSTSRRRMVLAAEVAILCGTFVAIWPAVQ